MTIRILLVPGFWLGAWAWDEVAAELRARGHEVIAHTPRGMDPADPDRLTVTLDEQAQGIVDAVSEDEQVILVLHSGAAVTGYLATDIAPERFLRVVYVDTAPAHEGFAVNPALDPALREWELPSWAEFTERMPGVLDGLDEAMLARLRANAISEPATIAAVPLKLSEHADRLTIPSTVICCTFTPEQVRRELQSSEPSWLFDELRRIDADYLELPTGHWPQFSRPKELAELIDQVTNR
ncbi:alpha/beta fold hydrolase [Nocardia arthritidis]|uniref:Alpha/beta fold hydrolase n=1 Tax=Nocardia arthritidis TaxID=228602 RepID=A0A6G9YD50_9NOCA|nr:alpha/beta hydrolase [Nocardia arthritidis]QIS11132.1 alpha/beta fold hydrolase [Nocardia arthritidis]